MPRWTEEEHKKYLKGVKKFGNSWVKVAEVIGTRDRLQCYEHSRSKSVVPYIRKKSSKSPSLRKRTSSTKSSSKKKKKSASNKRSTSVKRTKNPRNPTTICLRHLPVATKKMRKADLPPPVYYLVKLNLD